MVNKIIADYLKAGKRLVIPQFGAFIHKDTDGGVVFVPFLKKDDGVLAAQLSASYGLSNEEAYGVITEYIAQVQKSVTDRGSFVVEGVGVLRIDSNGVCYLEYNAQAGIGQASSTGASAPSAGLASVGMPAASAPSRPVTDPSASRASAAPNPVAQPGQPIRPAQSGQPVQNVPSAQPGSSVQPSQTIRPQASQPMQCPPPVQQTPQPRQVSQPVHPAQSYGQPSGVRQTGMAGSGQPTAQQPGSPQGYYQQPQAQSQQQAQAQQPQMPGQPYPGQPQQTAPRGSMPTVPPMASRRPAKGTGAPAKGTDKFLVIAILAAVVALGAIVYGVVTSSDGPKIDPMELPVHERPAILDSIQKQDSARAAEVAKTVSRSKR